MLGILLFQKHTTYFEKMEGPQLMCQIEWTLPDLNRSPHPCHGCALPDELRARAQNHITRKQARLPEKG